MKRQFINLPPVCRSMFVYVHNWISGLVSILTSGRCSLFYYVVMAPCTEGNLPDSHSALLLFSLMLYYQLELYLAETSSDWSVSHSICPFFCSLLMSLVLITYHWSVWSRLGGSTIDTSDISKQPSTQHTVSLLLAWGNNVVSRHRHEIIWHGVGYCTSNQACLLHQWFNGFGLWITSDETHYFLTLVSSSHRCFWQFLMRTWMN